MIVGQIIRLKSRWVSKNKEDGIREAWKQHGRKRESGNLTFR